MKRLPTAMAVVGAALLLSSPGCGDDGGSSTSLEVFLFTASGASHESLLSSDGPAAVIELTRVEYPDPASTASSINLDVVRRGGALQGLTAGHEYQLFARGFPPFGAANQNQIQFYGASPIFSVEEGTRNTIGVQVGRVDCFGLNHKAVGNSIAGGGEDMIEGRVGATVTPLPDGTVLLIGGARVDGAGEPTYILDAIERYYPSSGQFALETGLRLLVPRAFHTATALGDGRILIFGGISTNAAGNRTLARAVTVVDLNQPVQRVRALREVIEGQERWQHRAVPLRGADGRVTVLITGGRAIDGSVLDTALRYHPSDASPDPIDGQLVAEGPMCAARAEHTATAITRIGAPAVIAGGIGADGEPTGSVDAFSTEPGTLGCCGGAAVGPETGCFVPVEPGLAEPRFAHRAVAVADGREVLFIGGYTRGDRSAVATGLELLDGEGALGGAAAVGQLGIGRGELSATLLGDGSIVLAGGRRGGAPVADVTRLVPGAVEGVRYGEVDIAQPDGGGSCALSEPHAGHVAVKLQNGTVLVAGGVTGRPPDKLSISRRAEIYFPRVDLLSTVYGQ